MVKMRKGLWLLRRKLLLIRGSKEMKGVPIFIGPFFMKWGVICEKIVLNWVFLVKMFKKFLTNVKKMY